MLLAIAAGTGDVLMARLRKGRVDTARGAAYFLRETVSRVHYAGATGPLAVRADSGFYTHGIVGVCRKMKVRFSITVRQHQSVRNIIEAIPEADWTPILYCMEAAADVVETEYTPFLSEPDAAPVRLIVRRVKPMPGSQLVLFINYSYHACITDRDGDTLDLEADHHHHAEVGEGRLRPEAWRELNHLPSGRFPASDAHRFGRAGGNRQDPSRDAPSPRPDVSPARPVALPCVSRVLTLAKPVGALPLPS